MTCHREHRAHAGAGQDGRVIWAMAIVIGVSAGCAADRPVADASPPAGAPVRLVVDQTPEATAARPTNPLSGQRAYEYLQQICAIGPRISGSEGMRKQQELVKAHFEKLGGQVSFQRFEVDNPLGGAKVPMANLICQWHPERKERILLCAHYDTRPVADQDPDPVQRKQGVFLGANDGASGVAVMMELAHLMSKLGGDVGVDFALFDGEELVYLEGRDKYFLGSEYFAKQYAEKPPEFKYRWG